MVSQKPTVATAKRPVYLVYRHTATIAEAQPIIERVVAHIGRPLITQVFPSEMDRDTCHTWMESRVEECDGCGVIADWTSGAHYGEFGEAVRARRITFANIDTILERATLSGYFLQNPSLLRHVLARRVGWNLPSLIRLAKWREAIARGDLSFGNLYSAANWNIVGHAVSGLVRSAIAILGMPERVSLYSRQISDHAPFHGRRVTEEACVHEVVKWLTAGGIPRRAIEVRDDNFPRDAGGVSLAHWHVADRHHCRYKDVPGLFRLPLPDFFSSAAAMGIMQIDAAYREAFITKCIRQTFG